MSEHSQPDDSRVYEALSALKDGQASETSLTQVLQSWAQDAQLRATWLSHQVAAEALQSVEIASVGHSSDETFLARFRERMASEPVVLAPSALPPVAIAPSGNRWWTGAAAMAAGFVLLMTGVVAFIQQPFTNKEQTTFSLAGAAAHTPGWNAASTSLGPMDVSLASALSTEVPAERIVPTARHLARTSFGDNAVQGAGTPAGYAIAVREDQLDAFWAQVREQQSSGRSLTVPAGMVMPVFVIHAEP